MRLLIIVVLVTLVAGAAAWARVDGKDKPQDYCINLCVTLSDVVQLDSSEVMKSFKDQWGTSIACEENKAWADAKRKLRCYLVTEGTHAVVLKVQGEPLPKNLLDMTAMGTTNLSADQKNALLSHKGCILVEYMLGSKDKTGCDRVRFTTQLLITIFKLCPATGYVNLSAQDYRPKEKIKPFLDLHELEPTVLYLASITEHLTEDGKLTWLHTHGMEQFGVPDLEMKYPDRDKTSYYSDVLRNAALYLIDHGRIMKPGDTAELAGDGVIYRIESPKGESATHFGKYGGLSICRK